jgi:membrane peptidoglycan carboxypeptidase
MRKTVFWLILVIVFLAAFWWAGGGSVLPQLTPKPAAPQAAPQAADKAPGDDSAWTRVYRVVALKSAVDARIDKKDYVRLADIPLTLQQAIIAVEDHRFYNHVGVDIEGILRASLVNLQTGSLQEGASTITQQLVKNLFLTPEKTWVRKTEEVVLAFDLEARYSKEEILEIYLNTIYFGSGAKGIGQAARIYFGKKPAELTLAESAMLAGLPNAPSVYSPYVDFNAAKQRQAVVLTAMARYGFIGPTTAQNAREAPLKLAK